MASCMCENSVDGVRLGDQCDGGPVIWGTNEMGDQWAPMIIWGTNELGDQWESEQWDGGPMRGGISERIPDIRPQNDRNLDQIIGNSILCSTISLGYRQR